MNVVGISSFYHDSTCCILQDGVLVAAASEERFTRVKHDASLPLNAFRHCLEASDLSIADVDCIAYYELPEEKLARQLWTGLPADATRRARAIDRLDPGRPRREIVERLGYEGPIRFFPHHLSHAASSFFYSGFPEAAVLTVDGVGEWATTTYGFGSGASLTIDEDVEFPHSLGFLYSAITGYLGFSVNDGEYKVMGLAPYGRPRFRDEVASLVRSRDGGGFELDLEYFDFLTGTKMHSRKLADLFGRPPRERESELEAFHHDVAASMQCVLEEILLEKVRHLHRLHPVARLCLAGGVALNCVANGRIRREGPFDELFVVPAANDAGGALGAAALAHVAETGERPRQGRLEHARYGPAWSAEEIESLVAAAGLPVIRFADFAALCEDVAERLAAGRIVGWFQGRMELGPRALGSRSILADPRDPNMRDRVNALVKKREGFRPFAPVVLERLASEHFELDRPSPFMLETCAVRSALELPAITHVDGSARVQTVEERTDPRLTALLEAFLRRTGCPLLLNTSFNMRDEPSVCTPEDALACFVRASLDVLVLGDVVVEREHLDAGYLRGVDAHFQRMAQARRVAISHDVYTLL